MLGNVKFISNGGISAQPCNILYLLYKLYSFIQLLATDKNDNLTCEIIFGNFTCDDYADSALCFNAIIGAILGGNGAIFYLINR